MPLFKILLLLFSITLYAQKSTDFATYFEKGNGNTSANYQEIVRYYKNLDAHFETIKVVNKGFTDSGEPLQLVYFSSDKTFDPTKIATTKTVLLINNGIHAGEPDGIDASMQLFRDLAIGKLKTSNNVVIAALTVYNIGGCLNRNTTSRANQNGPEEYGFRGNARNFDLNRDFIKSDTKNTKSFVEIYQSLHPAIFIDNHVSNGADYQYALTYIMTEPKKLGTALGTFMQKTITTEIVTDLKLKNTESTPYVNVDGTTPDNGFTQFFDSPRFATGYTSLFNSIGFVVETHMLKKYSVRVKATYDFMVSTIKVLQKNAAMLKQMRVENQLQYQPKSKYVLKWVIDSTAVSKIPFFGFEASYKKSNVTVGDRLFYDRNKPFQKQINFYGAYKASKEIIIPDYYVVPKSIWTVTDLLKSNQIKYKILQRDTVITVQSYRITDYKTSKNPYEGHYLHSATNVQIITVKKSFFKGDYLISTAQNGVKYLLETLEPEAVDSFFNWNFFDTILQQKEGYSDYVFEDLAEEFLVKNPQIKIELEKKKLEEKDFAKNADAQLNWVYKQSPHYENAHLQYPIYRIIK